MAEFRVALETLDHTEVKTPLNSGNAVFSSTARSTPKLADGIAAVLQQRFGVSTPVIVKSGTEFAAIVAGYPIVPPEGDHSRFLVVFAMGTDALQALVPLKAKLLPGERMVVTAHGA